MTTVQSSLDLSSFKMPNDFLLMLLFLNMIQNMRLQFQVRDNLKIVALDPSPWNLIIDLAKLSKLMLDWKTKIKIFKCILRKHLLMVEEVKLVNSEILLLLTVKMMKFNKLQVNTLVISLLMTMIKKSLMQL